MSRTLLLNRAVALHRPRSVTFCVRAFSTSKPSKGDKEKRQRVKNFDSPGASSNATFQQHDTSPTKNKRDRTNKKVEGLPILVPPGSKQSLVSLPSPPFDRSHSESEEPLVHDLWTVNVSPFLDPQDFCKKSAFYEDTLSRNGTLAARRLLQGKERVLETLMENILQSTSANKQRPKPRSYAIAGHGVPKQLLQAHIDMADCLLREYKNAAEIAFKNSTGQLSVDTLRVCNAKRENRLEQWTYEQYSEEDNQMQLFLTVMNRISTTLSPVLWQDAPEVRAVTENEEEEDDDFVRTPSTSAATPKDWKVELLRGTENPSDSMLTPIVEWTLPDNHSTGGGMTVRLRGQPTRVQKPTSTRRSKRQKPPMEVTMIYTASFQNPLQPE